MPWVYDEKQKKTVFKKDASNYTPASTADNSKHAADDEWKAQIAQDKASAAAYDASVMGKNMPGYAQTFTDNRFKLGGSNAIKNSGIVSQFGTYKNYAPIISQNIAAGVDYLGMSDDEVAEYQKAILEQGMKAQWGYNQATARTGGIKTIDMTGMPKAMQQELNRGNVLYERDSANEYLTKPLANPVKPSIVDAFENPDAYVQWVAAGGADEQMQQLLKERNTESDNLDMYSAYSEDQLKKDLLYMQSHYSKQNPYNTTEDEYQAARRRVYAALGTDYDQASRESGVTNNPQWVMDALNQYRSGKKALMDSAFGGVIDPEYYRQNMDAMMKLAEDQNRQKKKEAGYKQASDEAIANVQQAEGYEENKTYIPDSEFLNVDIGVVSGSGHYEASNGEILNRDEYIRRAEDATLAALVDAGNDQEKIDALATNIAALPGLARYGDKLLNVRYLDAKQKAAFTAEWNLGNKDKAVALLDTFDPLAGKQRVDEMQKAWAAKYDSAGTLEKIGMNAQSVGQNVMGAAVGISQAVQSIVNPGELAKQHEYSSDYDYIRKANITRQKTSSEIAANTEGINIPFTDRNLWAAIYNGVMSGIDSAAIGAMLAPLGPVAQAVMMSGITFANERMSKLEAGYLDKDANMDAWINAAIEAGSEYLPFDIWGKSSSRAGRKIISGLASEALGETASELGSLVYDEAKYGLGRAELLAEGYGPVDENMWWEWVKRKKGDLAEAFVGGLVGAGAPTIISASSDAVKNIGSGKRLRENDAMGEIVDIADTLPLNDEAKAIVERMKAEIEAGKKRADEVERGESEEAARDDKRAEDVERLKKEAELAEAEERADEVERAEGEEAARDAKREADVAAHKEKAEAGERAEYVEGTETEEAARDEKRAEDVARLKEDASETEMTERDRSERADDGKAEAEEDAATVTKEDAETLVKEMEKTARDRAEMAEGDKGSKIETGTIDDAAITKGVAEAYKKRTETEQREAERKKQKEERKESKKAKREADKNRVRNAEIGYVYRQIMQHLDEGAKRVVSQAFTRDIIETELASAGFRGDMRKAADAVEAFVSGDNSRGTVKQLEANEVVRNVALSFMGVADAVRSSFYATAGSIAQKASKGYVKPAATAETGAEEAETGIDGSKIVTEEDVEVSDTPESTVDGKVVTIEGVKSVSEDGSVTYTVKDSEGKVSEVSEKDISIGSNDINRAVVAENAKALGKSGTIMMEMYSNDQNPVDYSVQFERAVQYGDDARNLDTMKAGKEFAALTPEQIEAAYAIGKDKRTYRYNHLVSRGRAGVSVGNVDSSGIDVKRLTDHQKKSVHTLSRLAKIVGFNVKFVESMADAEGNFTDDNGSWNSRTLTLTVDINAGSNKKTNTAFAMMHTAGHELTHYVRQFADTDLWNAYQEFVIGHLSTKENEVFNLEDRIRRQIAGAAAQGRELSRTAAIEEIIADASGEALNNITDADIQALAETNPGLLNKIKQFIQRWINSVKAAIKAAYSGTEAKTEEARMMADVAEEMGKRWNELFVNAAKNRAAQAKVATAAETVVSETTSVKDALMIDAETQAKIDNDEAVTADVEIKNSIRMDEQFGAEAKRINQANKYVPAEILKQALADRETIRKIFTNPKNLDLLKLPPDIEGDTFVSDSSYGGTEENTTVCIRSMAAQALMDLISQNLGRPLTVQDTLLISQEIAGLTDRPECYYCYVATDRRAYRDFLGQYLKQRNDTIEKYKAGADRQKLYDDFRGGRKNTKNMRDRFDMWIDAVDNGTALIDGNDLSSLENLFGEIDNLRSEILAAAAEVSGIDKGKLNIVGGEVRYQKAGKRAIAITLKSLAKKQPALADRINRYSQLTDATAYAQSASWAKKMKGYAAYNGHIMGWSQKRIDDLNKHYGLRMYSFSDFSPAFILENMQMVTDAAVRGLNMLGYTKEMPFAEIFAPTGMNINISTFAYEQGDEILEDYKQGASWERAKALREKHPNVGIVMVATSDKILEWALEQDWVDVVIPYHLVRTGTEVAKYFGYRNYTDVSADGKGLTFAEKNKGKAKKDKVTSVSPVEHRNDLISYVDALQRYGLTPRFADWLKGLDEYLAGDISPKQFRQMNPNYMKLVNETRRSYADTEPVQPRFDIEAAEAAIQQMIREGGYYTPVGGSMAEQFETAGNIADKIRNRDGQTDDGVKHSMRDTQGTVLSPQQAEYFKDSKAVDDEGNLLVLYHGTRAGTQISVFKTTEEYRKGLYLTDIPKVAEGFASKVIGRNDDGSFKYADIKHVTKTNFDDYDFETSGVYKMYANIKNPFIVYAGYAYYYNIPTPDEMRSGNYGSTVDTQEINAWAYEHGYDGVIVKNVREGVGDYPGTDVIVFDKNQVKFADNYEPTESDDIRYQRRDYSELSDRDILVRALESDLTAVERGHLEKYKGKLDELKKKQQQLDALRSRIAELRDEGYIVNPKNEIPIKERQLAEIRKSAKALEDAGETPETSDELAHLNRQIKWRERNLEKLRGHEGSSMISEELQKLENNATTLRGMISRADAQLNEIQSAAMIREIIRRNRAEVRKQTAKEIQERADKRQREAEEKVQKAQERIRGIREYQEKEKYRKQVETDMKRLYKWLTAPSNKGSVPEFLRKPVGDFLTTIDFSSRTALKGEGLTGRDIDFRTALENMRDAVAQLGEQQEGIDGGLEIYEGYIDMDRSFIDSFNKIVRDIKRALDVGGGTSAASPIEKMTAAQMKELSQAMRILSHSIVTMNELFGEGMAKNAKELSNTTIDELTEYSSRVRRNKTLEMLNSVYNWKNATPIMVFERLGKGGKAIFERLMNGWDKMAQNSARVVEYAEGVFTQKEATAWSSEISTVKLESGDSVQMTTAQKMSLYCLQKRKQAQGHLLGGGIRISDIDTRRGGTIRQSDNYVLTVEDIYRITSSLTERQREVANKLQEFMNTVCADWGNEISMRRFGFRQMTEMFYFPIETDANNRRSIDETKDGKTSMFRLLNMSALKQLTPKANNAIVVKDIFNVFADHASDMAKYNALALPILDFIKWYNHVEKTEVTNDAGEKTGQIKTRSTQKALEHAFGQDAKSYLMAFIRDLNAEHDGGRNDGILNRLISRAKSASVGANMRVYSLQITSLPRAAYAIDTRYLIAGATRLSSLNPVNAIRGTEAQENVGILRWKKLGFYSTDISRSTRDMIKRNTGVMGKLRDWSMAPAGWGDNWVSNVIYEAVKAEMQDRHPDVRPGTAAYNQMVNDRVREIVYKTQVVDSTMTRSENMRSKGIWSLVTPFMSEPTITINMLNEFVQKGEEARRKGADFNKILRATGGMAVRAATTFVITAFFSAIMESVWDAIRDDDEYETFLEKLRDAFHGEKWYEGNFVQNLNPLTMLPLINDVWSTLVEGYENNSLFSQVFDQGKTFIDAIKSYSSGKTTPYNVVYKGLQTLSTGVGLGVANATRDFASIYNTVLAPAWGTPKAQTYADTESVAAEAYYNAIKEGRTDDAAYYSERMDVRDADMTKVHNKMTSLIGEDYVAGTITEADARTWLKNEVGLEPEKIESKVEGWEFERYTGFKSSQLKSNVISGITPVSEAINLLMKYDGISKDEAKVKVNKWLYERDTERSYDDIKKDYVSGKITEAQLRKHLKTVEGLDGEKLEERISGYDYTKYTGKTTSAPKYWKLAYTYETGGDYEAYADEIIKEITAEGKTWKQARSSIASSLASYYKKDYLKIKGTPEGDRMLERILDVYEAIGYDRAYERKYIAENWTED